MLLDTLSDAQLYFKSTLLEVLRETRSSFGKDRTGRDNLEILVSYKSILRRENAGVQVYQDVHRDPTNGYRQYTGKQIRDIVKYEISVAENRKKGRKKK